MTNKLFIFLYFFTLNLFAGMTVDTYLVKNDSSYILNDQDIVFKGDKIKFEINSTKKDTLEIYYKINDEKIEKLTSLDIEKETLISFPGINEYIVLDQEIGTLDFIFKSSNLNKKIKLITNPKIQNIESKKEESYKKNERVYINKSKIISNNRGEKESNIIIPKLESSTVIINVNGNIGAGVIINNGENILTNYHVIEPNENEVFIALKPKLGNNPSKNNYYRVDVEKVDMNRDLALLSFPKNKIKEINYSSIELAKETSLKKGIDIYNMGHPLRYYFAFEYGMLTNILNDYSWTTHKADYILQYSMNSNQGNSGSPIVNDKLELIGIGAFSNTDGKNLNFGISVIDIKRFLEAKASIRIKKKTPNEYKDKIVEQGLYKNIKIAKLDRNKNGIPDAMMKDFDNDGIWDIIAYDTDEDGNWDRKTSF